MASQICLLVGPAVQLIRLARLDDTVLSHRLVTALVISSPRDQSDRASMAELRQAADRHDIAFLVADDLELLDELMADGIEIEWHRDTYLAIREQIGAGRSIGCRVGLSRHHAMEAAEAGADYVRFCESEPVPGKPMTMIELVEWWTPIFETPCMALIGDAADELAKLAGANVDFIAFDATRAAKGLQALVNMQDESRGGAR